MEVSTGTSFLLVPLSFLIDFLCIYFGYKILKWAYHMIAPPSAKTEPDPNLFYTSDGKPMRRAPWNGKLYEDMDEYEHDRKIAETAYSAGYSSGELNGYYLNH
jgi:hypothetical protein